MIKLAKATLTKSTIQGKFGAFEAYIVKGDIPQDTIAIKEQLKSIGFQFYAKNNTWWVAAKKITPQQIQHLSSLGVQTQQSNDSETNQPDSIIAPKAPESPLNISKPKDTQPVTSMATENPEMTKWYGFPMNKNILSYEIEFDMEGEHHKEPVSIDRSYVPGVSGKKSRDFKLKPRYKINIGKRPDGTPIAKGNKTFKDKIWGTYNENEVLEAIKKLVEESVNGNSNIRASLSNYYDNNKRSPELNSFIGESEKHALENNYGDKYNISIDDPLYKGVFPVGLTIYGLASVYLVTALNHPLAPPQHGTLCNLDMHGIHTMEQFKEAIEKKLQEPEIKKKYIDYLKSFPFLEEQKNESKAAFNEIMQFVHSKSASFEQVLQKLQEIGYIRPHKRQKQGPGISFGDEIKWIVDSKKCVNEAYGRGYAARTPEYFYAVVAYYIHRKVRGIWSWTDMMLVDSLGQWMRVMKRFGADLSFEEVQETVESIGNAIVNKVFGSTKEERNKNFFDDFYGGGSPRPQPVDNEALSEFANFAKGFGIDTEGLEENAKSIYRTLARTLHPDLYTDETKKAEMTAKFQELQNIWDRVPEQYRQASNWYDLFIYSGMPKIDRFSSNWYKI